MRKKTGIFLSVWLCISMLLLLLVSTPVHAAETNTVTLNFIGASVDGGKAVFDVAEGCKAKITLCKKTHGMVIRIVQSVGIACRSICSRTSII